MEKLKEEAGPSSKDESLTMVVDLPKGIICESKDPAEIKLSITDTDSVITTVSLGGTLLSKSRETLTSRGRPDGGTSYDSSGLRRTKSGEIIYSSSDDEAESEEETRGKRRKRGGGTYRGSDDARRRKRGEGIHSVSDNEEAAEIEKPPLSEQFSAVNTERHAHCRRTVHGHKSIKKSKSSASIKSTKSGDSGKKAKSSGKSIPKDQVQQKRSKIVKNKEQVGEANVSSNASKAQSNVSSNAASPTRRGIAETSKQISSQLSTLNIGGNDLTDKLDMISNRFDGLSQDLFRKMDKLSKRVSKLEQSKK